MSNTLYDELADWFHLLTRPEDYADEAADYRAAFLAHSATPPRTLLELGAGGGNNASHLKRDFTCTLTDLSPRMLEASRRVNPECEHVAGDMRTLRLERQFDLVLAHDAVAYMLTEADLRAAMCTAFVHCKPGGVALFAPDGTRESFTPSTSHGGHDGDAADPRALRYLLWTRDRDPSDSVVELDFIVALDERGRELRVINERHLNGLFPLATWLRLLAEVGFTVAAVERTAAHDELEVFVAVRPA